MRFGRKFRREFFFLFCNFTRNSSWDFPRSSSWNFTQFISLEFLQEFLSYSSRLLYFFRKFFRDNATETAGRKKANTSTSMPCPEISPAVSSDIIALLDYSRSFIWNSSTISFVDSSKRFYWIPSRIGFGKYRGFRAGYHTRVFFFRRILQEFLWNFLNLFYWIFPGVSSRNPPEIPSKNASEVNSI